MKELWEEFKRRWHRAAPYDRGLFAGRLLVIFIVTAMMISALDYAPASTKSAPEAAAEPEATEPDTFPASDFLASKLETKYNLGTWDGSFIRSKDGEHCASINERGQLMVDCKDTYIYLGTHVPREYRTYRAVYLGEVLYDFPFLDGDITRYDPYTDTAPQIILANVATLDPVKVSHDAIRFVTVDLVDGENVYTMMELNKTGEVKTIGTANHPIAMRGLTDYPEKGDLAEFWLLRLAYTSGTWDGSAKSVSTIAKSMKVNLPGKKPIEIEDMFPIDYRAVQLGDLKKLDFSHTNPSAVAAVSYVDNIGECIVIDNEPRYYLHATAPYLADDIRYRKISPINREGFAEIDTLSEWNAWDGKGMPLHETPCVRVSHATTPGDILEWPAYNFSTTAVALPYYDGKKYDGDEIPVDFLDNLEILAARNDDGSLRAVAIGYANTMDTDDPEANFILYLSRQDTRFVPLAANAVECIMLGDYSSNYLNGNHDAPLFTTFDMTIYGREKFAYMNDIFAYILPI